MSLQATTSSATQLTFQSSYDSFRISDRSSDFFKKVQKVSEKQIALLSLTPRGITCKRHMTTAYGSAPSMLEDVWGSTWDVGSCFSDSIPFKNFCDSCKSYGFYVIDKILKNYKNNSLTYEDLETPYRNDDLSLIKLLLPKTKTKELIKLLESLSFCEIRVDRDTTMGKLILDAIKERVSSDKDLSNEEGILSILIRPQVFKKPCDYDLPVLFIENMIKHGRGKELNKGFPMKALFEANFNENLPIRLKLLNTLLQQKEVASDKKHLKKALRAATLVHRAQNKKEISLLISFGASLIATL